MVANGQLTHFEAYHSLHLVLYAFQMNISMVVEG